MSNKIVILIIFFIFVSPNCKGTPELGIYYTNWSQYRPGSCSFTGGSLAPIVNRLSYIGYAFAAFHPSPNWDVYFVEYNDATTISVLNGYKSTNPNLKILLSIGGYNFSQPGNWSQLVAAGSTAWSNFSSSAISLCQTNNLDGIDLDWEWPGLPSAGGSGSDYQNYINFLTYLSAQLHAQGLLLTYVSPAAAPSGYATGSYTGGSGLVNITTDPQTYIEWIAYIKQFFDFYNLIGYDYYGAFTPSGTTDDNAPLYPRIPGNLSVQGTIVSYEAAGIPATFISLGVPAYGHNFASVTFPSPEPCQPYAAGCPYNAIGAQGTCTQQAGTLAYYEIVADIDASSYTGPLTNIPTYTAYAYNPSGTWVSFDTPTTAEIKGRWIVANGLKGGFIWAADLDNFTGTNQFSVTNSLANSMGVS